MVFCPSKIVIMPLLIPELVISFLLFLIGEWMCEVLVANCYWIIPT